MYSYLTPIKGSDDIPDRENQGDFNFNFYTFEPVLLNNVKVENR